MSLCESANSQLVVVDVQERLAAAMPEAAFASMKKGCALLLQVAGILKVPVICSEQYPKGLGATVEEIDKHLSPSVQRFEKTCFSCAGAATFQQAVENSGRNQVVLAGMEAHVCILQTAIELHQQGREVFVVEDAVCSRKPAHLQNALQRLARAGVTVTNTESVIFEWVRDAGHEHFRAVSALMK